MDELLYSRYRRTTTMWHIHRPLEDERGVKEYSYLQQNSQRKEIGIESALGRPHALLRQDEQEMRYFHDACLTNGEKVCHICGSIQMVLLHVLDCCCGQLYDGLELVFYVVRRWVSPSSISTFPDLMNFFTTFRSPIPAASTNSTTWGSTTLFEALPIVLGLGFSHAPACFPSTLCFRQPSRKLLIFVRRKKIRKRPPGQFFQRPAILLGVEVGMFGYMGNSFVNENEPPRQR